MFVLPVSVGHPFGLALALVASAFLLNSVNTLSEKPTGGASDAFQASFIMDGGDVSKFNEVPVYSWDRLFLDSPVDPKPRLEYLLTNNDGTVRRTDGFFALYPGDRNNKTLLLKSRNTPDRGCLGNEQDYAATPVGDQTVTFKHNTEDDYPDAWWIITQKPGGPPIWYLYVRKDMARTGTLYRYDKQVAFVKWTSPDKKGALDWQHKFIPKEKALQIDLVTTELPGFYVVALLVMVQKYIINCGY